MGMHYTSCAQHPEGAEFRSSSTTCGRKLEEAGDNSRSSCGNLRKRIGPHPGVRPGLRQSGNFLVIAYKEMRAIEAGRRTRRRGEDGAASATSR